MSLLSVADAISRVCAGVESVGMESVPLSAADGRVLASPLVALRTQPPFRASAMDGYAVRYADAAVAGAVLRLIGESQAGKRFEGAIGTGEAVRIFTGAPIPDGADAILIQENADRPDAATVVVREPVKAGRHVRAAGLDFREGQVLLPAGRRLGLRDLALAGAMNHATLPVRRRPVVAFFATGDELVAPGGRPGPDQIIASNSIGLGALVERAGGVSRDLGIIPDDAAATEAAIAQATDGGADVLATLGGASVGERDLVRGALSRRGMELDFWRIAMRPGMPLIFGRLDRSRVLGLPGNPVSSLVCAILFLRPLLSALLGEPIVDGTQAAMTGADLPANDHRQDYLRARLTEPMDSLPVATPLPVQDSSMLSAFATADCLLIRPPNAPATPAGSACRIVRLG